MGDRVGTGLAAGADPLPQKARRLPCQGYKISLPLAKPLKVAPPQEPEPRWDWRFNSSWSASSPRSWR
jgi:hypothetical protein